MGPGHRPHSTPNTQQPTKYPGITTFQFKNRKRRCARPAMITRTHSPPPPSPPLPSSTFGTRRRRQQPAAARPRTQHLLQQQPELSPGSTRIYASCISSACMACISKLLCHFTAFRDFTGSTRCCNCHAPRIPPPSLNAPRASAFTRVASNSAIPVHHDSSTCFPPQHREEASSQDLQPIPVGSVASP